MPWDQKGAAKHKKGLSQSERRKWVAIANSVLHESGDEGKAVRIANSKTRKGK